MSFKLTLFLICCNASSGLVQPGVLFQVPDIEKLSEKTYVSLKLEGDEEDDDMLQGEEEEKQLYASIKKIPLLRL